MPMEFPMEDADDRIRDARSFHADATFSIKDTFAEAFPMTAARLIVTADSPAGPRSPVRR